MQLLATGFYGWGNPEADFVFVGKEPGAANIENPVEAFAAIHQALGRPELADFEGFHSRLADERYHYCAENANIQQTFGRLIKFLLALRGLLPPAGEGLKRMSWGDRVKEATRHYQIRKFCRKDGETAAIELSAFPARDGRVPVPRRDYVALRDNWIRDFIHRRARVAVVYYCSNAEHLLRWEAIAGEPLAVHEPRLIGKTVHLVTHHPLYPGGYVETTNGPVNSQSDSYWLEMARMVGALLPED